MINYEMIKSTKDVEVLVIGGGAAGILAAISAGRKGKKVLLVEAMGALGGSRTLMGVDSFNGFFSPRKKTLHVVGGICFEVVEKLLFEKSAFIRQNTFGSGPVVTYDMEKLKIIFEDLVLEAGVDILYYSRAIDVLHNEDTITSVIVSNKSGLTKVNAKIFIDASGDMDVAAMAGEDFELAGENDKLVQSLTTIFYLANVDTKKAFSLTQGQRTKIMKDAHESGKYKLTRIGGSIHPTPHPGLVHANLTRIPNVIATDAEELTAAEIEGRKQVQEYVRLLKNEHPGFEDAYLAFTANNIGIRETRRLKGKYVLTGDDVKTGAKFDDAVVCCSAPIEDHVSGKNVRWSFLDKGDYYQIPYSALLPKKMKNLIVAGRCLSSTHDGQASARNSAQCMAMGEAAGLAAALSLDTCKAFDQLDIKLLQNELKEQGVLLEPKEIDEGELLK